MLNVSKITREFTKLNNLIDDLRKGLSHLFAYGVTDSQRAFLISSVKQRLKIPILVVCANSLEAKKLTEDLTLFFSHDQVCLFPASSVLPYETAARSPEFTAQRLKAIESLLQRKPVVVVATIQSLMTKMPPPDVVDKFCMRISVGDVISIEDVIQSMTSMGYERVDMIEGRGQFALRGGILDIYPLTRDTAVRLEFFDDEVDSIREFLPEDQRSISKLNEVFVSPAREVVYDREMGKNASRLIADELKMRREILNKVGGQDIAEHLFERVSEHVDKLDEGLFFEAAELYISHLYPRFSTIMDYFRGRYLTVMIEPGRIVESQKTAAQEVEETFKGLLEKGEILASQAAIYFSPFRIVEKLKQNKIIYVSMLPKIHPEFEPKVLYSFQFRSMTPMYGKLNVLTEEVLRLKRKKYRVIMLSGTKERGEHLQSTLKDNNIETLLTEDVEELEPGQVVITPGTLERGFEIPEIRFAVLSDIEVYGKQKKPLHRKKPAVKGKRISGWQELNVGDYVVHTVHGIGRYLGVETLEVEGNKKDYFALNYSGGDKLYVPTNQVDLIQKYIGSEETAPKISRLGGNEWSRAKSKVKDSIKEMAEELIKLYAKRQAIKGYAFSPDTPWQKEFEDLFPYEETPDQLTAIEEVKNDMESDRPMDRLLCGDVGYGKTEVAMRAAFKAVMDSKQVAVLVPTTILAEQHFHTFSERFDSFPVKVEVLSRFKSSSEQKQILKSLRSGELDIIIGTHRLLQKDVRFKDLGLLIVDEEQRFGVSHKERIKQIRSNVDVLTLTATPIPRTLHMAMSGVRDMSIIETPPEDRFPVQTYVVEHNESLIRDAIIREISRGGQVYYVYNRIETVHEEALKLQKLIPEVRIGVAHGKMDESQLEEVMLNFYDHNIDVLVCTTIIETGLDISNVNTLIVTSADRFGLAQLYQLRGRVGRSARQAFAYLTYKKDKALSEAAEKRLSAIREFTEFGSGFKIALRDLEIRGAGNILGIEQHGHMMAVGYDLYCKLLSAAVKELQGVKQEDEVQPVIELSISAYISDDYIGNSAQKMDIYRRIASVETIDEAEDIEEEIEDRFGDIPEHVRNLIYVSRIKVYAVKLKVSSIIQQGDVINIKFQKLDAETLLSIGSAFQKQLTILGSNTPTIAFKTRGCGGYKLLLRLEKFLFQIMTLHESASVV
ncbi:MAG: transcription-repair coupling factor [Thermoanaerobacterales bacterium]|nr:transcription-repair coupling factor [Thermoanaerobacterales bacterium]